MSSSGSCSCDDWSKSSSGGSESETGCSSSGSEDEITVGSSSSSGTETTTSSSGGSTISGSSSDSSSTETDLILQSLPTKQDCSIFSVFFLRGFLPRELVNYIFRYIMRFNHYPSLHPILSQFKKDYKTISSTLMNGSPGRPNRVVIANQGDLWVSDSGAICIYAKDGTFEDGIPLCNLYGIAIDHDSNIFVCDHDEDQVHRLSPFLCRKGSFDADSPIDLAFTRSGNLIVCSTSGYLAVYSRTGDLLKNHDHLGLEGPHGITVDNKDQIYVADSRNDRILILNPKFEKIREFKTVKDPLTKTLLRFGYPESIVVDGRGNFAVTCCRGRFVLIVSFDGKLIQRICGDFSGIAVDLNNELIVVADSPKRLIRLGQ